MTKNTNTMKVIEVDGSVIACDQIAEITNIVRSKNELSGITGIYGIEFHVITRNGSLYIERSSYTDDDCSYDDAFEKLEKKRRSIISLIKKYG